MKKARTYSFQCPSCAQSEILKTITTGIHKHNWRVLGNLRCCTPAKFMLCFCTKFHVSDPSHLSVSPPYLKIRNILKTVSSFMLCIAQKYKLTRSLMFSKTFLRTWPQDTTIRCASAASIPQVHTYTTLLVCCLLGGVGQVATFRKKTDSEYLTYKVPSKHRHMFNRPHVVTYQRTMALLTHIRECGE